MIPLCKPARSMHPRRQLCPSRQSERRDSKRRAVVQAVPGPERRGKEASHHPKHADGSLLQKGKADTWNRTQRSSETCTLNRNAGGWSSTRHVSTFSPSKLMEPSRADKILETLGLQILRKTRFRGWREKDITGIGTMNAARELRYCPTNVES